MRLGQSVVQFQRLQCRRLRQRVGLSRGLEAPRSQETVDTRKSFVGGCIGGIKVNRLPEARGGFLESFLGPLARVVPAPCVGVVSFGIHPAGACVVDLFWGHELDPDRKSTRLNSSHLVISYA